jgi:hypothetical protein
MVVVGCESTAEREGVQRARTEKQAAAEVDRILCFASRPEGLGGDAVLRAVTIRERLLESRGRLLTTGATRETYRLSSGT